MEREDVVYVLRRFLEALAPGGVLLDLQVIPPDPVVEVDGVAVCSLEGRSLLDAAAAATAVVDSMIARGLLREDAVDDHEILHHYPDGRSLLEDFETKKRSVPSDALALVAATERACIIREPCRLRRLRVTGRV